MIDRMSKALGVEAERGGLVYTPALPRFDESLDLFQETLREIESELVVVDPVHQCMNGEHAGNLFELVQQLKTFSEVALELGGTPVQLHHLKKSAWKSGRINPGHYLPSDAVSTKPLAIRRIPDERTYAGQVRLHWIHWQSQVVQTTKA